MSRKAFHTAFIIFVAVGCLIIFSSLYGKLTFGYGLADLYYIGLFIFFFLSTIILSILVRKNGLYRVAIVIAMLVLILITVLQLTIYRGPEYNWNGSLFYSHS